MKHQNGNNQNGNSPANRLHAHDYVRQRAAGLSLPLDACAREPIHVPGAIQPHGALIAIDPGTGRIVVCSANSAAVLGMPPESLLGRAADQRLSPEFMRFALDAWQTGALSPYDPLMAPAPTPGRPPSHCWIHASSGLIVMETECAPQGDGGAETTLAFINRTAGALRQAASVEELSRITARAVRTLTGFDRVLIYRFDPDWNGETVAEDKATDWGQPFLGLRFPASDIPAQARALYARSLIRFVADRDYEPVPLLSAPERGDGPLDLSGARLRSLSPIHLEYQRNIGVNGSMSASVLKAGALWGLVIGHHRQPHRVHPDVGEAVSTLVQAYGMRLSQVEADEAYGERRHQLHTYSCLIEFAAGERGLVEALTGRTITLADLFNASGAVVVLGDAVHTAGTCPPRDAIVGLVRWLRDRAGDGAPFAVDNISSLYPAFVPHAKLASGVLGVFLGGGTDDMLLWFRPEEAETIAWAGNPCKPTVPDTQGAMILPRRNFERWVEVREGHGKPWRDWEVEIAESLRHTISEVILRHQTRFRELQDKVARIERLNERETLLRREVDHRVKNSLQIIASILQLQGMSTDEARVRDELGQASRRVSAVALVHQRLYKAGEVSTVQFGEYLRGLCSDLAGSFGRASLSVSAIDADVPTDKAVPLGLVVNELVTNAMKHADRMAPVVTVSFERAGGACRLAVEDNGPGLPPDFSLKAGGGLGMRIVMSITEQIGGTLECSDTGHGTRVAITFP